MYAQKWHWLDYDPVAVAVLVIGLGMIELLAMIILPHWIKYIGQDEIAPRPWPAYRWRGRSTAGPSHYRTSGHPGIFAD